MMERRLTKEDRARYVEDCGKAFESHTATVIDYRLSSALHDIDAADEEIAMLSGELEATHELVQAACRDANAFEKENERLRILARRLYFRAIEGDEFTDGDIAELRLFGLIDDDGFPTYDDEEVE